MIEARAGGAGTRADPRRAALARLREPEAGGWRGAPGELAALEFPRR